MREKEKRGGNKYRESKMVTALIYAVYETKDDDIFKSDSSMHQR